MSFILTILGSNSALPTSKRFSSAHVLNVHERFYLIDCGEGAQIQLRKNKLSLSKINNIFISHLHGDHYYGLFGLISTFSLLGRTNDLHIYTHLGLEKKINIVFSESELNFKIIYHKLNSDEPEIIYEDKVLTVKSFPLKHRIKTCGFLFKEKSKHRNIIKDYIEEYKISIKDIVKIKSGADYITSDGETIPNKELTIPPYKPRSYAYCSDTKYNEDIIPVIKNTDILYHEATFDSQNQELADDTWHSTSTDAAKIAEKANVKKLLIGHFSARYKTLDKHLEQARCIFTNTFAVNDNEQYSVKQVREKA